MIVTVFERLGRTIGKVFRKTFYTIRHTGETIINLWKEGWKDYVENPSKKVEDKKVEEWKEYVKNLDKKVEDKNDQIKNQMSLAEARLKEAYKDQAKVIEVLYKYGVDKALTIMVNNYLNIFTSGDDDDKTYFYHKGNEYKFVEDMEWYSGVTGDGIPIGSSPSYVGSFELFFNGESVFETSIIRTDGKNELAFDDDSLKKCRLGDWVKDLPNLMMAEKEKLDLREKQREMILKKREINDAIAKTKENFDIGEFDEEN